MTDPRELAETIRRSLHVLNGESFTADEWPSLEDAQWATVALDELLALVEQLTAERDGYKCMFLAAPERAETEARIALRRFRASPSQ